MGLVTVFPGGSLASFPSPGQTHRRAARGEIKGWTPDVARRMVRFLWSVETDKLDGHGFAITLTMGGRPATADDWARARHSWLEWLNRNGATRVHWLTEWTREARPHLHACVYGLHPDMEAHVALAWLKISRREEWPAEWFAQSVEPIYEPEGWLKYVAKHSARGVDHYQRDTPPEGWEKTGRLWGRTRVGWPVAEPVKLHLTNEQTWRYMALLKQWQARRMRSENVPESVVQAFETRRPDGLQGVSGWIPYKDSAMLILAATDRADYNEREINQ